MEQKTHIERLLKREISDTVTNFELQKNLPIRHHVSRGIRSANELIKNFIKKKQKDKLSCFPSTSMCNNVYSTRHLIILPQCKDFIECRSSETFNELVSYLVARSRTRTDEMQKAFEACGTSEQVLCTG